MKTFIAITIDGRQDSIRIKAPSLKDAKRQCDGLGEGWKVGRFNVLSPDGFSIDFIKTYLTYESAVKAFEQWIERYKIQGYYSSNRGRIGLDSLADCCQLIYIK